MSSVRPDWTDKAIIIIRPEGDLGSDAALALEKAIDFHLYRGIVQFALHLRLAKDMSSEFLSTLVYCATRVRPYGGDIKIIYPHNRHVLTLLRYGQGRNFDIRRNEDLLCRAYTDEHRPEFTINEPPCPEHLRLLGVPNFEENHAS